MATASTGGGVLATTVEGTRGFVPAGVEAWTWDAVEPLHRALLDRPVRSGDELERWLVDRSELDALTGEAESRLYIAMTCNTDRPENAQAFRSFVEDVKPHLIRGAFALDRRQKELTQQLGIASAGFKGGRYSVLAKNVATDVEIFRDENVPLHTELEKLGQDFQAIVGAMSVEFEGQERTLPQMAVYQERTERGIRERAWRAVAERRLQDVDAIDGILDQQVELRDRLARNAGFADYIGYTFASKHRFDYTPEHCRQFHEACERVVVPMVRRLEAQRARELGVGVLRPWDLAVDIKGREPLKPFKDGSDLVERSRRVFDAMGPELGGMFRELGGNGRVSSRSLGTFLDLDSRKGKGPGGYQSSLERERGQFIFMNAAGTQGDIRTMVHEAGHAFHSKYCREEPLVAYRFPPIEFCEVASMGMELLSLPHWKGSGRYYEDEAQFARAKRDQIEKSVTLLPWIAIIDAFQLWMYAHPGHSRRERTATWLSLQDRLGTSASFAGLERHREVMWQRQSHIFTSPMYYIEYGIAQLGALQLWLLSLEKGEQHALECYGRAMRLGGSRPLPELFKAAGLAFDFGPAMVGRLVERVERELEKLPV